MIDQPAKRDKRGEHYPGLIVMDGRVTGSITLGNSRLPIWCIPRRFDLDAHTGEGDTAYGVSNSDLSSFTYDLFDMRRPWARLICVLADEQRIALRTSIGWFADSKRAKKRLRNALQACIDDLDRT